MTGLAELDPPRQRAQRANARYFRAQALCRTVALRKATPALRGNSRVVAAGLAFNGGGRKEAEKLRNLRPQFFSMHDLIDQTVFLEKLGRLKSFGQILMRRFPDHAWSCEPVHAFRLGDDSV